MEEKMQTYVYMKINTTNATYIHTHILSTAAFMASNRKGSDAAPWPLLRSRAIKSARGKRDV